MKKFPLLLTCLIIAGLHTGLRAQEQTPRCGLTAIRSQLQGSPDIHLLDLGRETGAEPAAGAALKSSNSQVVIPVIFHIVVTQQQLGRLGGEEGLLRRIETQMHAINEDFNAENADHTQIPDIFKPLRGKSGIQFGLARRDPSGNLSHGYQLKIIEAGSDNFEILSGSYGSRMFCSDVKYDEKGFAAWDPSKYLNVWVSRILDGGREGILGIATPPSFTNQYINGRLIPYREQGVVLNYGVLGKRDKFNDYFFQRPLDRGRTLTHEIGHFFELEHIWGSASGCGVDDGIHDTPPQNEQNYGCPSYPKVNCDSREGGEMFMNFMDYVNDGCMHLFTHGQVARMKAQIAEGGRSHSLTQHSYLTEWPAGITEADRETGIYAYPNPASGRIMVHFSGNAPLPRSIAVLNMHGQRIKEQIIPEGQHLSSAGIDMTGQPAGIYLLQYRSGNTLKSEKIILQ